MESGNSLKVIISYGNGTRVVTRNRKISIIKKYNNKNNRLKKIQIKDSKLNIYSNFKLIKNIF